MHILQQESRGQHFPKRQELLFIKKCAYFANIASWVLAFYTQYRRCFSTYLTSKNVRNVTFDRRRSQRFESWTFASDPAAGSTYVTVWVWATTAHKQHSLMGICVSKQNKVLLTWGSAWLQVRVKYSSESILFTTRMRRRRANRLPSLPGNRRTLGDDCPTCTEWRSQAWRGCHREPSGRCTLFRFRGRRSLFWGWILTSLRCDARVDIVGQKQNPNRRSVSSLFPFLLSSGDSWRRCFFSLNIP